jgi:glycosyltransferase involved in cell wall biosynthesis
LWAERIQPNVPDAELHIFAGAAVYGGGVSDERAREMERILTRADALSACGVRRHAPVGREMLASVLAGARVMLYRGDPGETFCLALAEAQAMGVPAVVQPIGAVAERVTDGCSGRVARTDETFVEAAVAVLRDDTLWREWHRGALATRRGLDWDTIAGRFESVVG